MAGSSAARVIGMRTKTALTSVEAEPIERIFRCANSL